MKNEKLLEELKTTFGSDNDALVTIAYPYILRKYTTLSLPDIAALCGTSHATVLRRVKDCEKLLNENSDSKFTKLMDDFVKRSGFIETALPAAKGMRVKPIWTKLFWLSVTATIAAVLVASFKVFENANRVERIKTLCEGCFDLRAALYLLVFAFIMLLAGMLANEALKRVLNTKERWLLFGAAVVFVGGLGYGARRLDLRILGRSVDATMEYHKLMRYWEPIWAEEAKRKAESSKIKPESDDAGKE